MDKGSMDCAPCSRSPKSIRIFNQIPLSSTMLHKSLPTRISAENVDSGLASANCTQTASGSESSYGILGGRQCEDVENRHQLGEGSANRNIQTPHGGFMLLRKNLSSRGSSTPKRCVSNCPFPTPDRLNEPFITHEVFESQLLALQEKNSFSPCIDWQSAMNPTAFDTSNPAAYLPPVRSHSAEQRYEKAINAFFQRKVVPSPTPTTSRRATIGSIDPHNSTIELKSPASVAPKKSRTLTTQTEVTIPPNCDIGRIFAPFATFTETETKISMMEMSRSSSSSSASASSLSRRKLFSEDDFEDSSDENPSKSVFHNHYQLDETVALSSPPRISGLKSASEDSFNAVKEEELGEDSSSREGFHIADIEEIPRGSLDIDLSPIRPQISACDDPMETKHSSAASPEVRRHDADVADDTASTIDMSIV